MLWVTNLIKFVLTLREKAAFQKLRRIPNWNKKGQLLGFICVISFYQMSAASVC